MQQKKVLITYRFVMKKKHSFLLQYFYEGAKRTKKIKVFLNF